MTVIAGIETETGVIIGGDSASVSQVEFTVTATSIKKVFRVGDFVIGCAGSFRMAQLLRYRLSVPVQVESESDAEYLSLQFTKAMKKCFKSGEFKDLESETLGGELLVGYKGKIYAIYPDLQVNRSLDGFAAIGSSATYALGSLITSSGEPPRKRVQLALEASRHFSAGVCPPYHLTTIDGGEAVHEQYTRGINRKLNSSD